MKNNYEKLIQKTGARVALTENERAKMRLVLREYAEMKPVRKSGVSGARTIFIEVWLAYLRRPAGITIAAVLILALSSSGIAYAAGGALPGDTLYPIKVAVVEPVRVALAASPEAKASLQMAFAENRVDEAATLASKGELGTTTEAALAANFNKNATDAAVTVAQERTQNPTTADVLSTNFAARLAAYQSVLAAADEHSHDAATASSTTTAHFQGVIQMQIASITGIQADEDAQSASSPATSTRERSATRRDRDIRRLQSAADAALRVSADIVGTASSTLDASSSASARGELLRASILAEQGRALLEQHDDKGASRAFQDSLSATARLDVLTRAATKLDIQAFAPATAPTTPSIKAGESSDDSSNTEHSGSRSFQTTSHDQENQDIQFGL